MGIESASSEGGDHDDVGAGADFVVCEFFHFVHLLSHVDEFKLIDGHSFFVFDVFFEHADSVFILIGAGHFSVGDSSDLKGGHVNYYEWVHERSSLKCTLSV